ncbi:MAG: hypothetical protein ABSF44_01885 [Candidatus Bathyarchaeia archaeon]|jgi:hypothetical protein
MYSVRTHSLRKFFRSQLSTAKIDTENILYRMGHTIGTYEDVQSLGVDKLRSLYVTAGLAIRPKTQLNRIEQLKEIIRAWGENPEEILSRDALIRGNITETHEQTENHQLTLLGHELKELIKREVMKRPIKLVPFRSYFYEPHRTRTLSSMGLYGNLAPNELELGFRCLGPIPFSTKVISIMLCFKRVYNRF